MLLVPVETIMELASDCSFLPACSKKKSTFSSTTTPDLSAAPSPTLLSPSKLEDLLPQVVNRLSPSNIKRTATDLMNQWEKSLASPIEPPAAVEMKETSV